MKCVDLINNLTKLQESQDFIYDEIIDDIAEYCDYVQESYPEKKELRRIYIVDSYLNLLYDCDGEYYELEIPLNWFSNKEQMIKDFKKKRNQSLYEKIDHLETIITSCTEEIEASKHEIKRIKEKLENE